MKRSGVTQTNVRSQRFRRLQLAWLGVVITGLLFSCHARGTSLPAGFSEQTIGGTWDEAVGLLFEDNGRMYVWERAGRVWIVENGVKSSSPLIDIHEEVGGWRDFGLLGFALDPNFRANGYIYLLYVVDHHYLTKFGTTNYSATTDEYYQATIGRITRYTANSADGFRSVDMNSRRVLLGESITNGMPILYESHGVGTLLFGTDGTLLASCGDGASYSSRDIGSAAETYYQSALNQGIIRTKENVGAYRAQLVDSLSGKVIRIDPATGDGIPGNPFYDSANPRSARSRVWALGLRNPCRMALRPGTGSHNRADANPGVLYIGDVGWDTWEELNVATGPGRNFGWPYFEGLEANSQYSAASVANQDAPNPLYNTGGCTQRYFYFRELIKQDSLNGPSFPNSCNSGTQIPTTIPRFVHTRAALDWHHSVAWARTPTYDASGNATISDLGSAGCPVSGASFQGNCSIGGVWYTNTDFPAQFRNIYFHADYGQTWIRALTFDANNKPVGVSNFLTNGGGIVSLASDPKNGGLYYISWTSTLKKISYGGNQPPIALATANKSYGASPLTVQLNGSGSSDPEGRALSYSWNFGDGTANSTAANPTHTFNAPAGVPTKFTVTLTVKDNSNATAVATLIISANNTPPSVTITNPVRGIRYGLGSSTTYNLQAVITDAEQSEAQMLYQWQTILHHNNHEHTEPINTNHATTTVISPVGCDGNLYYYRILLTVTDPAGLSGTNEVDIYPACSNAPPLASFAASTTNGNPPLTVSFDAAASNDPDGDPLGYAWDFGDGTIASGLRPTHSYTSSGDFTVRLTVTDTFGLNSSATKKIHANGTPTISSIAAQTVAEDTSTGPINFTVGDLETAAMNLTVIARSSNLSLVPNANITLAGSASNRTVTIQPATNLSGNSTITLVVTDGGGLSSTNSFVLTVTPVNDPPVISSIANQTIVRNNSTALIPFAIGDIESSAGNLTVTGVSSNQTLIPNSGIVITGSGSNRFVTLRPATNQIGSATVALIVNDGSATSQSGFTLNVVAPPARISIKVNFQPATAPIISGYLVDAGMVYGDRGNGQIYGWDTVNTSSSVDRDSTLSPDQRFDTLNLMQPGGASRVWEIAVSNGFYTVLVVAGDPNATTGSYRINAEGASLVNGTPSSTNRWIYGAKTINVTDGRLTLTNASGAVSNKICWIDIVGGPAASGAIGPADLTLLGRDTNGWPSLQIQGQAGRNYVIEASSNLQQWYPAGLFQNMGGTLVYIDKNTVSNTARFYRVFLVP